MTLTLPQSADPGRYAVVASGVASGMPAAATVDVAPPTAPMYQPQVTLSPSSGPHGSLLSLAGNGFAPRELLTITFRSAANTLATQTIHANGQGILDGASMTVPDIAAFGAAQVTVTGAVSKVAVATPFDVTTGEPSAQVYRPSLNLTAAGADVVVAGSGFAPNEVVTIAIGGGAPTQTVRADASGSFGGVRVPARAEGDQAIDATGADSLMPVSASFTVRSGTVSVAR